MKRYGVNMLDLFFLDGKSLSSETIVVVKAEDAEKLEQQNNEMLEVLKESHSFIVAADDLEWEEYSEKKRSIRGKLHSIISKAEGV